MAGATAPSIFGRPQIPSPCFPLRLPMNSFTGHSGSQLRPGIWPNVNPLGLQLNHVVAQERIEVHASSTQEQQKLQVPNFQGKSNGTAENYGQTCPLNKDYSCDACQKDFTSQDTLNAHLGSHVQCSYEGCTFKAGRKVLKLHWIQTHETGRMKINLDTDEEIAKWREERKRKYPTAANVERKMAEEAKRKASGHVLKTKNFRYRRGQRGGRTFQRGGNKHFNNRAQTKNDSESSGTTDTAKNQTKEQSQDGDNEHKAGDPTRLENGADPLSLVLDGSYNEEDDTGSEIKERLSAPKILSSPSSAAVPSTVMSDFSALGSLCSAYASDSGDDEEPAEVNNNKHKDCSVNEKLDKSSTNEPEAGKATTSTPPSRRDVKQDAHSRRKRTGRRSKKCITKANSKSMGIRKSTLLEKLLAPEIRHERNVILQCLRHIVKRNFFDVGDTNLPPKK